MAIIYITLKRCSRKAKCINPLGEWLPKTVEYFGVKSATADGLTSCCKVCKVSDDKAYVAKTPDIKARWNTRGKRCRDKNPERRRATKAKSYRKNKANVLRANGEYDRKHPEMRRAIWQKRRAKKKAAGGSYNAQDVLLQHRSQKGLCWWCGIAVGEKYDVDHRIPIARGGSNAPENIVISCVNCNRSKGSKLPSEWSNRLL